MFIDFFTVANVPVAVWTFLLAIITVWITTAVGSSLISWLRNRRYRIGINDDAAENKRRESIAAEFNVPGASASASVLGDWREQLKEPLKKVHEKSILFQSQYHDKVGRCVTGLALSLLLLSLGVTIFQSNESFRAYAAAVGVLALAYAFRLWWSALKSNHAWITSRTKAELLRQWTFLSALFQLNNGLDDASVAFATAEGNIDSIVRAGKRSWWQRLSLSCCVPATHNRQGINH